MEDPVPKLLMHRCPPTPKLRPNRRLPIPKLLTHSQPPIGKLLTHRQPLNQIPISPMLNPSTRTDASPEEEISSELNDVDSRAIQSNEATGNEAKLAKAKGNRTFTMRELLNELKNGDPNNDDAREVDTPHRI